MLTIKMIACAASLMLGEVHVICEPWQTIGTSTINYARKTGLKVKERRFMLGTFDVVNDVVLGISVHRISSLQNKIRRTKKYGEELIEDEWFLEALRALPVAVVVRRSDTKEVCGEDHNYLYTKLQKGGKGIFYPNDDDSRMGPADTTFGYVERLMAEIKPGGTPLTFKWLHNKQMMIWFAGDTRLFGEEPVDLCAYSIELKGHGDDREETVVLYDVVWMRPSLYAGLHHNKMEGIDLSPGLHMLSSLMKKRGIVT